MKEKVELLLLHASTRNCVQKKHDMERTKENFVIFVVVVISNAIEKKDICYYT